MMPTNFPLKSLLQASKKMAACNTHLDTIDFLQNGSHYSEAKSHFKWHYQLTIQSSSNIPNKYTIQFDHSQFCSASPCRSCCFFKENVGEYPTTQISKKWCRTQELNSGWSPPSQ
jgi:hypothetical protein